MLRQLRHTIEPLLICERLPGTFGLQPGLRLRRAYGRCRWSSTGNVEISVRCTADGDRQRWRQMGSIMATLLHELAHLRYRHHGPRFWSLHRRLVDRAAALGIYDAADFDPAERARGDEKLAPSAAVGMALAARAARRARARADRAALATWSIGTEVRVVLNRRSMTPFAVRILAHGRTRLLVETLDGRRYRVPPVLLSR